MTREEWMQDIRNRQRNIVFPDTMLNAGRFYRNIVYEKTPLRAAQRIGIAILVLDWLASSALQFVAAIEDGRNGGLLWFGAIVGAGVGVFGLILCWRLALRALLPGTESEDELEAKS